MRMALIAATLIGFLLFGAPLAQAQQSARPNVIFILMDDMRWDCMSCAGHPFIKTPNIDRIAREGAMFKNYFVTLPLCSYCSMEQSATAPSMTSTPRIVSPLSPELQSPTAVEATSPMHIESVESVRVGEHVMPTGKPQRHVQSRVSSRSIFWITRCISSKPDGHCFAVIE